LHGALSLHKNKKKGREEKNPSLFREKKGRGRTMRSKRCRVKRERLLLRSQKKKKEKKEGEKIL